MEIFSNLNWLSIIIIGVVGVVVYYLWGVIIDIICRHRELIQPMLAVLTAIILWCEFGNLL